MQLQENYEQPRNQCDYRDRSYEKERDPENEIVDYWNLAGGNFTDQVDLATLDRASKVPFNLPSPTQGAKPMQLCGLIGEILVPSRTMLCLVRIWSED